jgi:glycogen operon protein
MKNAVVALMCSRGTPMFLMGDEFCNTQFGNNNPYCQDNEISWLDWSLLEKNRDMYEFTRFMIKFRKEHKTLRRKQEPSNWGFPDVSFHSERPWESGYTSDSRAIGVLFAGKVRTSGQEEAVYLAMNMWWEPVEFTLPQLPAGHSWKLAVNTGAEVCTHDVPVPIGDRILLGARSAVVLVAG